MKIVIAVTLYNSKYIEKTISSIKLQTEQDWICIITNDLSTDDCVQRAGKSIDNDPRFIIINNKEKHWQTGNYWQICNRPEFSSNDVLIELDGDDWFSDDKVLTRVKEYYKDPNLWITYGSFVFYNNGEFKPGFARPPIGDIENQRNTAFTTSHLRTWRIGLFRKLEMKDITEDNGKDFIPVSGDLYFFQCMLEMAREKHTRFITDINYVYNNNELSEHIVSMPKVYHYTNKAKTRPVKKGIESI